MIGEHQITAFLCNKWLCIKRMTSLSQSRILNIYGVLQEKSIKILSRSKNVISRDCNILLGWVVYLLPWNTIIEDTLQAQELRDHNLLTSSEYQVFLKSQGKPAFLEQEEQEIWDKVQAEIQRYFTYHFLLSPCFPSKNGRRIETSL